VPPYAQEVLATFPEPVMFLDAQLHLVWANRILFETFGVGPGTLGRPLAEAWGSTSDPVELWAFLEELIGGRSPRDVLIDHPFGQVREQPTRFTGRLVPATPERPLLAAVYMRGV